MSRKKKTPEAVPAEILAEGSGPVGPAADVTDDAEVGMPVAVAEAKPAKRKRGRKAEVVETATEDAGESADSEAEVAEAEVADAEEISAAVDARADDVADELAASAGEAEAVEPVGEGDAVDAMGASEAAESEVVDGESADGEAVEVQAAEGEAAVEGEAADGPVLPAAMDAAQLRQLVEALIFATDKPITLQRLRQLSRISDVKRIEQALAELAEDYKDRGIALHQVSGGYQFRTNTAFSPWVQQLIAGRPVRLSRAQLETLAIIAYRQPITRPEIDEIRGVDSSATLRLLLDRALVRVLGKREEVGRPILYGTTKEFLDFFSLGDLRELPTLREYSELTAESRQVMSDRLGVPLGEEPGSIDEMGVGIGDIDVGINRDPTGEPEGQPGDPADLAGSFPAASAAAAADASDAAIDAAFERDDTGTDDDAMAEDEADDPEPEEARSSTEDDEARLSAEDPLAPDLTTAPAYVSSDDDAELASAANTDELEDSLSARAARRLRELDDRDPISRDGDELSDMRASESELGRDLTASDLSESELGRDLTASDDLSASDAALDETANPDPIVHGLEPSARASDPIATAAELDPVTFDHEPGEPAHEPIDEPNE